MISILYAELQTVLFIEQSESAIRILQIDMGGAFQMPLTVMQVGGRSIVCSNIKQIVELRSSDDERFARLLEILGELATVEDPGKTLIFVNSQEKCSNLFQQLLNYGYANQMLHGDMQQVRSCTTIAGFIHMLCWSSTPCCNNLMYQFTERTLQIWGIIQSSLFCSPFAFTCPL